MQAPGERTNSDEPCDICGAVADRQMIATCTMCHTTREHVYCMRVFLYEFPEDWVCESCMPGSIVSPEACGKEGMTRIGTLDCTKKVCRDSMNKAGQSSGGLAFSKRQKPVETGKVKFISTEEAIKLSSSATNKRSGSWTYSGSRPGPSYSMAPSSESNPVGCRMAAQNLSTSTVNLNPGLEPSGLMKPPRHGGVDSMISKQAPQASKRFKEPKVPVTSTKGFGRKEQLVAARMPDKVAETFKTNVEKATSKASLTSSPSKKCLPFISSTGKGVLVATTEELVCEIPLMEALIPDKEVETSNTKLEKATNKASCKHSASRPCLPIASLEENALLAMDDVAGRQPRDPSISKSVKTSAMKIKDATNKASCTLSMHISPTVSSDVIRNVAECKNSHVEERDLLNILPKFKLHRDNLPALHPTWKGGFVLPATPAKFYGGFQAQPPCTVNRKAFEFSKRMPPVLKVKLLPWCQMWGNLFQNDCPDLKDIALYFFPADNIERSKENMASLFELMEVHDSMMKSCIDGVELLIFTSKQLHLDLQMKYLLGVFRPVKKSQTRTLDKVEEEHNPLISPLECGSIDHNGMNDVQNVGMEIDMEGGKNVGRVDMVVPRDASRKVREIHMQSSTERKKHQSTMHL